ncbi:dihydrolipoamide acetyltransferase family protein [Microbacterium sp. BWT-B31]|uniref:dihydrolipoamide acetyltransferase family protein n=1 Tax=Microbacterium sp. BWT-B31 TaxID=3232072 RepID=UPI00352740D7
MATVVRMPAVMAGATEAAIQTWLVEPGQSVSVGTPLAEVETEKAVIEYASEVEGTVLKLLAAAGDDVAIGAPIALVGAPGETVEGVPGDGAVAAAASHHPPAERRLVSPLVRRLARERGIDLELIPGSGPGGRVVRRDLEAYEAQAAAPGSGTGPAAPTAVPAPEVPETGAEASAARDVEEIPLTRMRRAIARRLTESKTTVPHFYLEADCRVDRLLELRTEMAETAGVHVSVNDFVLKAVAGALADVPEANATWGESVIRRHRTIDLAVAVAVDDGLVTPIVRDVDRLTLTELSATVSELAARARAGRLSPGELEGAAFGVSNLGMYGVWSFSAIINPPHAGILAVGAARPAPVVVDGALAVGTLMSVTLSADHRVIDGAVGARWLAAFVRRMEHPLSMLV